MTRIFMALLAPVLLLSFATAQESVDGQKFLLRYAIQAGEQLRYEVTHVAKTKTRITGSEEASQVRTTSQRRWDIVDANESEITFDHIVDSVEMTQQQGDADEIRWASSTGEEPPAAFAQVAAKIGRPLATVTINALGQETRREDHDGTKASLGMGTLALALPEQPIAIGESWSVPREVKTRTEEGEVKPIKIRELYTLAKVQTGVATLTVRSEPLTPINHQSIRAQVVQQLSEGVIRFDIDNGRLLSKQLDWDERVVGFQGANSLMEYRAKVTEVLIDDVQHTARRK